MLADYSKPIDPPAAKEEGRGAGDARENLRSPSRARSVSLASRVSRVCRSAKVGSSPWHARVPRMRTRASWRNAVIGESRSSRDALRVARGVSARSAVTATRPILDPGGTKGEIRLPCLSVSRITL